MHANIVLSHDLLDYSPLFVEIADAYFDMEMYKEASPLYELLGEDAAVGWLKLVSHTHSERDHGRPAISLSCSMLLHVGKCWGISAKRLIYTRRVGEFALTFRIVCSSLYYSG